MVLVEMHLFLVSKIAALGLLFGLLYGLVIHRAPLSVVVVGRNVGAELGLGDLVEQYGGCLVAFRVAHATLDSVGEESYIARLDLNALSA